MQAERMTSKESLTQAITHEVNEAAKVAIMEISEAQTPANTTRLTPAMPKTEK